MHPQHARVHVNACMPCEAPLHGECLGVLSTDDLPGFGGDDCGEDLGWAWGAWPRWAQQQHHARCGVLAEAWLRVAARQQQEQEQEQEQIQDQQQHQHLKQEGELQSNKQGASETAGYQHWSAYQFYKMASANCQQQQPDSCMSSSETQTHATKSKRTAAAQACHKRNAAHAGTAQAGTAQEHRRKRTARMARQLVVLCMALLLSAAQGEGRPCLCVTTQGTNE